MKILHLCISNFYIEGYNYQENILSMINKQDGHDVYVIASNLVFENNDNTKFVYIEPTTYTNDFGVQVQRVQYKKLLSPFVTKKIKAVDNLYGKVEHVNPDIILFHGTSSVEIRTLIQYKKNHPDVKIYIDSHADFYTSGTNWLSRKLLHGVFFSHYLKKALPYIEKILYVSTGCGSFLREVYKIPESKIEFYSLGGVIPTEEEKNKSRNEICEELEIGDSSIILLQAGKFDRKKKLIESLSEFIKCPDDRMVYLVCGSLSDEIKDDALRLFDCDKRIRYLGWKSGKDLHEYLNACDVYVQPGKVSAIAQDAICRGSVVILNNLDEYKLFVSGNGWLINDPKDLYEIFTSISNNSFDLDVGKEASIKIARKYFDYNMLAKRLYQ